MDRLPWMYTMHWTYGKKEWDQTVMFGFYPVSIYKDTTGQYTDEECDADNCVEIPVPINLLWKWFVECAEFDREECCWTPEDGWGDLTRDDLKKWVFEESTCDDTQNLYDWLCDHKYFWNRLD